MRRLRRYVFAILATISLLLCLASAALWLRSATHFEEISLQYRRYPEPAEYRHMFVSFSWYSNTLRLAVTRYNRSAARFRQLYPRSEQELRKLIHMVHGDNPAGMHWSFNGEHVRPSIYGFDPGFRRRHIPFDDHPLRHSEGWVFAVRPWLPTLLTALLPAIWIWRFIKSRRAHRDGVCHTCGYDLRATPDRCPECGTTPPNVSKPDALSA
jgi:hypothetical protein